MARTIPTIMPDLTFSEAIEVTKIYSVSGELDRGGGIMRKRPVRAPHHTATTVSLAGGGSPVHPGDISMAHCGVLFMDELPEFNRNALEVLRQPLEDGRITIARASGSFQFPARFMLVAAMNPCPCGYFGSKVRECRCTQQQIQNYLGRVSGPLLDRMDIQVEVGAVEYSQLAGKAAGEPSASVRSRVNAARKLQESRYSGQGMLVNAGMGPRQLEQYCKLDDAGNTMMEKAFKAYGLSARAFTRILKVARTVADLEGAEEIGERHLAEAIQYRVLDKKYWGQER
jgi:magnesium chelatase family protein